MTRLTELVGAATLLFLLAGCAAPVEITNPEKDENMTAVTLEDAKGAAQALEQEVFALIPTENVGEVVRFDLAELMRCGEGEYKWPGGSTTTVVGNLEATAYLESVAAEFTDRPGWTVTDDIAAKGQVEVRNDSDGLSVYTSVEQDGGEVWIRTFSQCFPFDPAIGQKY